MAKWSGLACPDCGCKRMRAYCTRRIEGGNLRVRECMNPDCGRRVHTIESIRSNSVVTRYKARKAAAGSPGKPGQKFRV
jgi:transcriptional regulator NrdR family protein